LPLPLPPLAEQRRVVAEVERRLSVGQELEATLATNLARAERLQQSILKRACEWKLVPQIEGQESALEFLEKLRRSWSHKAQGSNSISYSCIATPNKQTPGPGQGSGCGAPHA
jgi:hypothetical protein